MRRFISAPLTHTPFSYIFTYVYLPITFVLVDSDMGFGTLPRVDEFRRYIPNNPFVGRAKDGQVVDYVCIGSGANFAEFRKAFSVEDARDLLLYHVELRHLYLDAISVVEGRNISRITFYDCKGTTLTSLLQMMDCEYCTLLVLLHVFALPTSSCACAASRTRI